jgi:predicted Zn finger-like uncharacterized protein
MKIVCSNCDAKYRIPQERIAGRKFRIRCKRCDAFIVIDGNAETADDTLPPSPAAARARISTPPPQLAQEAPGGWLAPAGWYVLIGDDQHGPLAIDQLADYFVTGTLQWDSYIWREGYDDWRPASEVPELVEAAQDSSITTVAQADHMRAAARKPESVNARRSTPPLTGARNEDSVLFRLDNLRNPAGDNGVSAASAGRPGAWDVNGRQSHPPSGQRALPMRQGAGSGRFLQRPSRRAGLPSRRPTAARRVGAPSLRDMPATTPPVWWTSGHWRTLRARAAASRRRRSQPKAPRPTGLRPRRTARCSAIPCRRPH